jgi:hypothetical protein
MGARSSGRAAECICRTPGGRPAIKNGLCAVYINKRLERNKQSVGTLIACRYALLAALKESIDEPARQLFRQRFAR